MAVGVLVVMKRLYAVPGLIEHRTGPNGFMGYDDLLGFNLTVLIIYKIQTGILCPPHFGLWASLILIHEY